VLVFGCRSATASIPLHLPDRRFAGKKLRIRPDGTGRQASGLFSGLPWLRHSRWRRQAPDGSEAALERARAAAGERDLAIAGGAATMNQYLAAGLIDELRLHLVPLLLGAGERLLEGAPNAELEPLGQPHGTALVTHLRYRVLGAARAPAAAALDARAWRALLQPAALAPGPQDPERLAGAAERALEVWRRQLAAGAGPLPLVRVARLRPTLEGGLRPAAWPRQVQGGAPRHR
jgi:hypothetical protein